jgi:trehalose 2-sulfotransferase
VFGTKLLWYQADRLERKLPAALGQPDRSLVEVLAEAIGNPRYIYLNRRDHVRQAVSFARAIQTEQWRSMDRVALQPQYDAGAISAAIHALEREEANWEAFFTRADILPHRLSYEDLDSAPREAIGDLMRFLGYQGLLPNSLAGSRHQRQADDVTENWVRRYETEEHP